ncbi:aa3-type cytochrome c oxidase subunit IV [Sneathiella sp.]
MSEGHMDIQEQKSTYKMFTTLLMVSTIGLAVLLALMAFFLV